MNSSNGLLSPACKNDSRYYNRDARYYRSVTLYLFTDSVPLFRAVS